MNADASLFFSFRSQHRAHSEIKSAVFPERE
jgi:hypothetical protein